jgi:NADPH-dependent 2,4-dienoyl-CoA reductase/sulfur reductase-like enzyme/rhodanese-related sulfurtransferase
MKIIIVGGVAGGASTATRLRRLDEKAEIILFEKGEYISYANCGLPYYIGDVIKERDKLFVQTPDAFGQWFNIDVRVQQEVISINKEQKSVKIKNSISGKEYEETYDKLVLSPGADPFRPPMKGLDNPKIFTLRSVPDTDTIKNYIIENKVKNAVVVGGGFIGLEMVENLCDLGIRVSVIEMSDQVIMPLDYSMATIVHQHLLDNKVNLMLCEGVDSFENISGGVRVNLCGGKTIDTDMVIWSIGVRPNSKLAQESGLAIGKLGGITVNAYMQTSDPDIYAVGDAVEIMNLVLEKPALIPLAGPANKQGRIAANNIVLGNKEEYKGSTGIAIAKIFDLTVAAAGTPAKVLKREGIDYISSFTHSSSHAGYYPDALPLTIKIVFSPKNGQLFGALVVGHSGVDKRIEMLAQVIQRKGTVMELCELEHAYAPPYSSAKDPVNMAGFVAENILAGRLKVAQWRDVDVDTFILDVRAPHEFDAGHIKGAVNIPLDELRQNLDQIPHDRKVVVNCASGTRSYIAYRILVQSGFDNVFSLSGGYKTYEMATKPLSSH